MRKIITCYFIILSFYAKAQIKIGSNPKTIQTNTNFQVESTTGNQFVITKDSSKVGIGTLIPAAKLDVIGNVKITDGTQGNGKVLVSDANGKASWQNASTLQTVSTDSTTASNGLTLTSKDVQLGGTLTKATTISTSATNTIALGGLQSGVSTDSILVSNPSTGVVRRISPSVMGAATEPWFNVATNAGATTNTQNIYQMGKVGININNPVEQFEVNGNIHQRNYTYFKKTTGNTHAFIWTNFTAIGDAINYSFNYHNADGTKTIPNSGYNTNTMEQRSEGIYFNTSKGQNNVEPNNIALAIRTSGRVGVNTGFPTTQLHVIDSTNNGPLRLEGLQSGASTDSILVSEPSTCVVRRISPSVMGAATEPWFNVATNAGATSNTQNIYQLGNVSIGTSNQLGGLTLYGNSNISSIAAASASREIVFGRGGVTNGLSAIAGIDYGSFGGGIAFFTKRNNGLNNFNSGGAIEAMRINDNQYVGIGTSNPPFNLSIIGNESGGVARVYMRNSSATANSAAEFLAQNNIGANVFIGVTSSTSTAGNGYTGASGTSSYIKNTAGPLYAIAGNFGVYLVQSSSSWTSTSDRRTKKNIEKLENGLSKLITISGYTYNYIKDEENAPRRVGLMAQEVKEVLPEAVSEDNDGILGIKYTEVTPLIIEAVKDLKKELDEKNNELTQQKKLIDQLFKELQEIKSKIK